MDDQTVLEKSKNIYNQLTKLLKLIDHYNSERVVLISLEIVNSSSLQLHIVNLQSGLTSHAKYTYSDVGVQNAWMGLKFLYNQIINKI